MSSSDLVSAVSGLLKVQLYEYFLDSMRASLFGKALAGHTLVVYSMRCSPVEHILTSFDVLQGILHRRAVILLFNLLGLLQPGTSPDTPQQRSKVLWRLYTIIILVQFPLVWWFWHRLFSQPRYCSFLETLYRDWEKLLMPPALCKIYGSDRENLAQPKCGF